MALLKVSDNYSAYIVGNFSSSAETITVDVAPVKTSGYLTIFDLNGNQLEKIRYTGVDGLNLTGCVRGLSFDDNSDTPVVGLAQDLKNGMAIKMTVTQHYINPIVDVINGDSSFEGVPKNPSTRVISDNRHLVDKEYVDGIASAGIIGMLVSIDSGVNININAGTYILNGTIETYAGVASEPLTDDDTNYIQLVDGVLDINTTGFSDDAIPLATAVCESGEITSLIDSRPFYTGFDLKENSGLERDSEGLAIKTKTDGMILIDNDGQLVIDEDELYEEIAGEKIFGDGSDGDVIISENISLERDMNYSNLTIESGAILNPNGYRIYVANELKGGGKISLNGANGGDGTNAEGTNQGAGGTAGTLSVDGDLDAITDGKAGANGVSMSSNSLANGINGTAGTSKNPSIGSNGSAGGAGGNGGADSGASTGVGGTGGGAGTATNENLVIEKVYVTEFGGNATANDVKELTNNISKILKGKGASSLYALSPSAGGGSGGSGGVRNTEGFSLSGGGGGSGSSGGIVLVFAKKIENIIFEAIGGNGGNGGNSRITNRGAAGGSGGGAGGSGGSVILIYETILTETINVDGGIGGVGGTRAFGGGGYELGTYTTDGQNGNNGQTGKYYKIKINNLSRSN